MNYHFMTYLIVQTMDQKPSTENYNFITLDASIMLKPESEIFNVIFSNVPEDF